MPEAEDLEKIERGRQNLIAMTTQIPFGIRDQQILHISEVDRGRDCDCVCPDCGRPLVARKGFVREHHFAHDVDIHNDSCGGCSETLLHRYAKRVIGEAGYLVVPSFFACLPPPSQGEKVKIPGGTLRFDRVEIEDHLVMGSRRIDVVGYHPKGRLLIEVVVTHRVQGQKLKQVRAADESLLEIVLPRELLFPTDTDGERSLRSSILDTTEYKRWIVHPEGARELQRLADEVHRRRISMTPIMRPKRNVMPIVSEVSKPPSKGHVPARSEYSDPAQYVAHLHEFLAGANYDVPTHARVVKALRQSGNITDQDIRLAESLGISLV